MSLVELLVTMLLLAVLTVMGWRALDGLLASRAALTAQLDTMRGHQLAFAQLDADCAHLVRSAAVDGQPTLSAAQGRLVLLRTVTDDAGAEGMQVVAYYGDGAQLTRSTSPPTRDLGQLRAAWQSAVSGVAPLGGVALDSQVAAIELHTWDGAAWQQAGTEGVAQAPRMRTRRVVRPPAQEATGLKVVLVPAHGGGTLVRMFMLGAG